MKKLIILFILISNVSASGQVSKKALLTGTWNLKSDEMSGVGIHESIAKGTELKFLEEGTWKSSHPINKTVEGTWSLENNEKTLVMNFGEEEIEYLLVKLAQKELHYRLKQNVTTYNYKWLKSE